MCAIAWTVKEIAYCYLTFFFFSKQVDKLITYTYPEIARFGLLSEALQEYENRDRDREHP
jgi:hypothetical protein